jgi:hypothetical protein
MATSSDKIVTYARSLGSSGDMHMQTHHPAPLFPLADDFFSGWIVDAIAAEVGYVDGATLRTLLRERLGRGVCDLRADLR